MSIEIHPKFKLNGIRYTKEDLIEVGYSFIKEGEPYEQYIGDFLVDWCNASTTISVQTSGSTGVPKPILLKKQKMVNSALATGQYFDLKPGNTVLHCLPAEFIAGKMMLVRAMVLGLEIRCIEPTSNPLFSISKSFDFCAMVPLQVQNSLQKLNQLKRLIVGGAPITEGLWHELQSTTCRVFETYGMTETCTHIAVKKVNPGLTEGQEHSANLKTDLAEINFNALPNVLFSVDKRGCLMINAPDIIEAPLATNDMVKLISETRFQWLGRLDHVINSGGVKLNPEQIEHKLAPMIKSRFFVTGLPDTTLGQRLTLIIEGEHDIEKLEKQLQSVTSLSKYELPKTIYSLPKFLETETGKIRRKENVDLILPSI
ncbi:MAG: AMP-binding protein [Flavobacteriaceae bacterium]